MSRPSTVVALLVVALCTLACSGASGATANASPPFSALGFDAAAARAQADGKLLLLDFTASWCPPCRKLEQHTWPDAGLAQWIATHAVAIQVDVDEQPELARRFGVQSLPTLMFLRDGSELERRIGFQPPDALVAWGDALRAR